MKRLSIFCITFLLLCYTGFGQISQNEFDRLVDYVNVYYSKAYLDKKVPTGGAAFTNDYQKKYSQNIKPRWEIYLDESYNSDIIITSNDFGGHSSALKLFHYILAKKNSYSNTLKNEEVIKILLELPDSLPIKDGKGFKDYLKISTVELESILNSKLDKQDNNPESGKKESQIEEKPKPNLEGNPDSIAGAAGKQRERFGQNNSGFNFNFLKIGLLILIAITLLVIIIYRNKFVSLIQHYLKMKPNNSKIDGAQSFEAKVKELQFENLRLRGLENDNAQLHLKNKQLELRVRELEKQLEEFNESTIQNVLFPSVSGINQVSHSINDRLYAEAIVEGAFYGLSEKPNADTVYELLLSENGKNASFRIYTEAYKRVIKNPDFVDGCDKQKVNTTPQDLDVETGTASQDDFGKWKVTKKAIIIFK